MNLPLWSGLGDSQKGIWIWFFSMLNLISEISSLEMVNLIVPEKSLSLGDVLVEHFIAYRGKLVELMRGEKSSFFILAFGRGSEIYLYSLLKCVLTGWGCFTNFFCNYIHCHRNIYIGIPLLFPVFPYTIYELYGTLFTFIHAMMFHILFYFIFLNADHNPLILLCTNGLWVMVYNCYSIQSILWELTFY